MATNTINEFTSRRPRLYVLGAHDFEADPAVLVDQNDGALVGLRLLIWLVSNTIMLNKYRTQSVNEAKKN